MKEGVGGGGAVIFVWRTLDEVLFQEHFVGKINLKDITVEDM